MDNLEVLQYISGFHQYVLDKPVHITFASKSLCDLTGLCQDEIVCDNADLYINSVHPVDRKAYSEFIEKLSEKEQTLTLDYRIVCKDGTVKYVQDTVTSQRGEDGVLVGVSTLCDITALKSENESLRFLNDSVTFGFLKFTCDKNPRVTYVNERLLEILRFPEASPNEIDYRELYSENIFLMISMKSRQKFANFLKRVEEQEECLSGEVSVNRCDGSKATLYGWVARTVNDQNEPEFQCVCADITERHEQKKVNENKRYIKALSKVYDKIFEYDFLNETVKYLHGNQSDTFGRIHNIPMQLSAATKQWLHNTVAKEDLKRVQAFFDDYFSGKSTSQNNTPPQIRYRAMSSSGTVNSYLGIFLKIDDNISLYCCKAVENDTVADDLRNENLTLKSINENMQELIMKFTEGIMAFEVSGDGKYVTPRYASENIYKFFGYTADEWLPMTKQSIELSTFVSRSGVDYNKFAQLLQSGEAEFSYIDTESGKPRRIKAICSEKKGDGISPRYVMLYNVDTADTTQKNGDEGRVCIRTFGYFDVFIDDRPIAFRNKKSKELLALLVDRRGGYISSVEAIGFLWEDEPANSVTLARYRKVALRLKNILEEYGITDIVESVDGKRRIVTDKVKCDLYDYLSGDEEYSSLFKGSYLTNYSWGENTLGELMNI